MPENNKQTFYIFDFDSTLVTVEALDVLAEIALANNSQKESILKQIKEITQQGMSGVIPFNISLKKRLHLFSPNEDHVKKTIKVLKKNITSSFIQNKDFFRKYKNNIYIISGGFEEYILPIADKFSIDPSHVLANKFIFDNNGRVIDYDTKRLLSQELGKVKQLKQLNLTGKIIIIGDGYTDYQVKLSGVADEFFAFTENITRKEILSKADKQVSSLDEFLYYNNLPRTISYPKQKMKVLLLENIHPLAEQLFRRDGYQVETINHALSEEDLSKKIKDVSIIGIRSKTQITKNVLNNANKLLTIGAFCIGTNQIDLSYASSKGIAVFNAPYSNTRSVVELAIGEIIMLYRAVTVKNRQMHEGIWEKSAKGAREIRGKKLGIIGYGHIGSQLSVLAENLGMEVYFYDVMDVLPLGNAKKCSSIEEMLKVSDIVTVHVDGRKTNKHFINQQIFSLMKEGSYFLNLSRGFVVDTKALVQALKSGKVTGAAIDVFEKEPDGNTDKFTTELQHLTNVILTPHIAGSTQEAQENIGEFVTKKLLGFINTGTTMLACNFPEMQLPELTAMHRFIHIHHNVPGVLATINNILSEHQLNIEGQYLKTNEEIGYVITDVKKNYDAKIIKALKAIPETIRFRILY